MSNKKVKKYKLDDLICLFIILNPILDILSFVIRNSFYDVPGKSSSITMILRPIIPVILGIIVFIKSDKTNKKELILIGLIYLVYALEHILVSLPNFKGWSYGNPARETSFLINYTFFILVWIVLKNVAGKDSKINIKRSKNIDKKLQNSIIISLAIYVVSIYLSIFTKTSSYTYPIEEIGYKGWIESGNSLSVFLVLGLGVLLNNIHALRFPLKKNIKENRIQIFYYALAIFLIIYLIFLMGTRIGLLGSGIIICVSAILKSICNKEYKVSIMFLIVLTICGFLVMNKGSMTLNRRKQLEDEKQNFVKNEETVFVNQNEGKVFIPDAEPIEEDKRYVTTDIENLHERIISNEVTPNEMTDKQKQAVKDLYQEAEEKNIDANDNRSQQMIYHRNLYRSEHDFFQYIFGNGFQTPSGELVLEQEIDALIFNFGILGFILYMGPIIYIIIFSLIIEILSFRGKKFFKNVQEMGSNTIMYTFLLVFAVGLMFKIGYTLFNISDSTLIATLMILVYNKVYEIKNRK